MSTRMAREIIEFAWTQRRPRMGLLLLSLLPFRPLFRHVEVAAKVKDFVYTLF
jgi:hypothetical protein